MLTDTALKNIRPKDKPYRVWDNKRDGFGVQVSTGGAVSFFVFYRFSGKRRFMKLGRYPDMSLKKARDLAGDARELVDQGIDPQLKKKEDIAIQQREAALAEERARLEASKGTVSQLFDKYIEQLDSTGKRTGAEVNQIYRRDIQPVLGGNTKAKEVVPDDIRRVLSRVISRNAMVLANRTRSYMLAAFKFGIEHDLQANNWDGMKFGIASNPVRDVPKPLKKEKPGERELNEEEVRQFWKLVTTDGMDVRTKIAIKLILSTGQRVEEVLHAQWDEFSFEKGEWEIPAGRTKTGSRTHIVPLPKVAQSLLKRLKLHATSQYLFPARKDDSRPMPNTSLAQAIRRLCENRNFEKLTTRDLRRTWKSRAGELGLSKEIRDRIQNHAMNDVSSRHYDKWSYLPEKSEAMTRWNEYLMRILRGKGIRRTSLC